MSQFIKRAVSYYAGARHRAKRRKSGWNALLIPVSLAVWAGTWYLLFELVWAFHIAHYPGHLLKDFWPPHVSLRSGILSFVMVFSLGPGAGALGFMLTNLVFWTIPPARKAFDSEAKDHPDAGFRETMQTIFKLCLWTLSLGILAAFFAAYFLSSLR
ncbi:MAG TPA: hypothetical protein VHB20_15540 [Verrucomicrobiae bacterium]|jgi:hypothetical protein|nr:hypothetical protein [Verrucomicrobiae bacterium]